MSKPITFHRLDAFLLSLGFTQAPSRGAQRVYKHENPEGLVVLPGQPPKAVVGRAHLAAVRRTLADMGLIDPLEFVAQVQAVN